MMNRREETNKVINELNSSINMLSVTNDADTKNKLLGYMRCKLYDLYILNNLETEPCGPALSKRMEESLDRIVQTINTMILKQAASGFGCRLFCI